MSINFFDCGKVFQSCAKLISDLSIFFLCDCLKCSVPTQNNVNCVSEHVSCYGQRNLKQSLFSVQLKAWILPCHS